MPLRRPVRFTGATPVREWLAALEAQMRITLAHALAGALRAREQAEKEDLAAWASRYPAQVVILALQVQWTDGVERALAAKHAAKALAEGPLAALEALLRASAQSSSSSAEAEGAGGDDALLRRKLEQAITVAVHQRDATRALLARAQDGEAGESVVMGRPPHQQAFEWLRQLRFYWSPPPAGEVDKDDDGTALLAALTVRMADAAFPYGFEYLGVGERLVQTPLTDRCYLTLTQALHHGMGGNPFGPAGACVRCGFVFWVGWLVGWLVCWVVFLVFGGYVYTTHTTGASISPSGFGIGVATLPEPSPTHKPHRHGQDGEREGAGRAAGAVRPRLQLRRALRPRRHGPLARGAVPGRVKGQGCVSFVCMCVCNHVHPTSLAQCQPKSRWARGVASTSLTAWRSASSRRSPRTS